MIKRPDTNAQRLKRHKRVRAKMSGTPERPRLNVFRSEKNIYAQVIDDVSRQHAGRRFHPGQGASRATAATRTAAKKPSASWWPSAAKAKGIDTVVFDRGGYLYHGRVAELAEGAREGGLEF